MKIFIISLVIIFCFFFSYSASAQTTNATPAQTTNPTPASPPTITGYNDTSTIVIDYKHPVLNQIPIDRPFNIMVTGIDTSLKKIHLNFYQIETRPVPERKFTSASADGSYYEKIKTSGNGKNKRKTRHRNSLPAGPISSEDLKKFTIKKVIPCGGGNVAQGQTNFVPVQQFHPNRNYIFDLSSDSSTLNQTQQADLRNYLKGQFATDTTLKKIIYSVESHYYQKRSDAFVGFAAANDKIKRQIKTIMNSKYPNYNFYYNFKYTSGFRHIVEIASIAGKIRDIDTVLMICDTSVLHSSNKGDTIFISKADSLINAIDTTFKKLDWVSLIDTASVNSVCSQTKVDFLLDSVS